jgi:hypothetical protein
MNAFELYKHITAHITAEEALMKLLEGHVMTYEKLKFNQGEEIHPIILISMAAMDMGWDMAVPNGEGDEEIEGMIVGTNEYIDSILKEKDNEPETEG